MLLFCVFYQEDAMNRDPYQRANEELLCQFPLHSAVKLEKFVNSQYEFYGYGHVIGFVMRDEILELVVNVITDVGPVSTVINNQWYATPVPNTKEI